MSIGDVVDFLTYFGINRQSAGPLIVAAIFFYFFFRIFAEKPMLSMKTNMVVIKDALCEVQSHITGKDGKDWLHKLTISSYGVSNSPMIPNELGRKLLHDIGFNSIYEEVKKRVFPLLDSRNTRTLYDAERNSFAVLNEISSDPIFDDVKSQIVSKPNEVPDLDVIFGIASWLLRDDYAHEREIEK